MEDESTYDQELYNLISGLWVEEFNSIELINVRFLITAPYMMYKIETFKKFFKELLGSTLIIANVKERLSEEELIQYNGKC